jgi:serine phosphatase RsbU (regulator of sigma subunit)
MMLISYLSKRSRPFILLVGLLIVILLGSIDYATGPDISFLVFYLFPVFLTAWFAGMLPGVLLSVFSACIWFVDDAMQRTPYTHPVIPFWNVLTKLVAFLVFIYILLSLKRALEREKTAEQERFNREIEVARQVQSRLFPQVLPPMRTLDYTGICKPAFMIGGDYYDFLQIRPDQLGIVLGDVVGKGIPSALLMASLYSAVRSFFLTQATTVNELIGNINRLMCASTDSNKYATLFYGLYDEGSRTFTYVNAGHNPPLRISMDQNGDSHVSRLGTGGTVIGLFRETTFKQEAIEIQPGDVLVFFTDGLTEARNPQGEEFGEEKLTALVKENLHSSANDLLVNILDQVSHFIEPESLQDDLTLLIVKILLPSELSSDSRLQKNEAM